MRTSCMQDLSINLVQVHAAPGRATNRTGEKVDVVIGAPITAMYESIRRCTASYSGDLVDRRASLRG